MRPAALLVLAGLLTGCAFDIQPCQTDDDCPPDTQCLRPPSTGAPVCIAPDEVDGMDAGTGPDAEQPDTSMPNNRPTDTPTDEPNNMEPQNSGSCPAVSSCGEFEPNDTEDDALYLSDFAGGCSGFGVENWSFLHQDSLCAGDVDQFILEYVRCEEGAFRITASLTTPGMCTGDLEIAEGLFDCSDNDVRCEIQDGVHRITIIVDEQPFPQPVEKIRFKVSEGLASSGLEYILRVTIGR